MKKYVIISGFNTTDNNRGTAALGYGSVSFMHGQGLLTSEQELLNIRFVKKFWKKEYQNDLHSTITQKGITWKRTIVHVFILELILADKFGFTLPFTRFGRLMRNVESVAAINGGDGFSDIYGTALFQQRLPETRLALGLKIPHIILPQTLGPFKSAENKKVAERILKASKKVYVRDDRYVSELKKMGIDFTLTKDLSAFMQPEPWDIDIKEGCIGLNVSGLCYSNKFNTLSGQFEQYPALINAIIRHFQQLGKTIYLIPHSYRYGNPEESNDDMIACKEAYNHLEDKTNVVLLDKDLISPQVKYVISKMSFFIGTRMHANFAAIYTGVPLFGLAYSYKFAGAFNANGLDGEKQTIMINNTSKEDIDGIIQKIETVYQESIKK